MTVTGTRTIRVELHAHTCFSKDSLLKPENLLAHCKKVGIDKIAITDHNTIEGALATKELAPERVIVGEEIETTQGELIGYFMTEFVPPGLTPMEAIAHLRTQGAVISVAHPFDSIRSQHWEMAELSAIAPFIDAVETFNARCMSSAPNVEAAAFARKFNLLHTVGSDAHSLWELGRASLMMVDFKIAGDFKAALETAKPEAKRSPAFVHLFSRYAVLIKKLRGYFK